MDKAGVICYIGVDGAATVIGLKSHNRERETRFSPPSLNRGKARSVAKRKMYWFSDVGGGCDGIAFVICDERGG